MFQENADEPPRCERTPAIALADDTDHWLNALLSAHGVRARRQRTAICALLDEASDFNGPTPRCAAVIIELYLRSGNVKPAKAAGV